MAGHCHVGDALKSTLISLFTLFFVQLSSEGTWGLLTVILGGLTLVFAVALLLVLLRRGKRDRALEKEPVEALELRKRLLTDALKTLEVEHDNKKIPDAYYQSIKHSFKQEAVRVLRELERRP